MTSPDDTTPISMTVPLASSGARTWVLAVAAGLIAGVIAWGISEKMFVPETGVNANGKKVPLSVSATDNGIIAFGTLGATLGLGLGLAGGLIRKSFLWAFLAAVTGCLIGGAAGVFSSKSLIPIYFSHQISNDILYSLLMHGGIWVAVGAAAGLAFGIGQGGWNRILRLTVAGAARLSLPRSSTRSREEFWLHRRTQTILSQRPGRPG